MEKLGRLRRLGLLFETIATAGGKETMHRTIGFAHPVTLCRSYTLTRLTCTD